MVSCSKCALELNPLNLIVRFQSHEMAVEVMSKSLNDPNIIKPHLSGYYCNNCDEVVKPIKNNG